MLLTKIRTLLRFLSEKYDDVPSKEKLWNIIAAVKNGVKIEKFLFIKYTKEIIIWCKVEMIYQK